MRTALINQGLFYQKVMSVLDYIMENRISGKCSIIIKIWMFFFIIDLLIIRIKVYWERWLFDQFYRVILFNIPFNYKTSYPINYSY